MNRKKKHLFHLVDESPLPFIVSGGALFFTLLNVFFKNKIINIYILIVTLIILFFNIIISVVIVGVYAPQMDINNTILINIVINYNWWLMLLRLNVITLILVSINIILLLIIINNKWVLKNLVLFFIIIKGLFVVLLLIQMDDLVLIIFFTRFTGILIACLMFSAIVYTIIGVELFLVKIIYKFLTHFFPVFTEKVGYFIFYNLKYMIILYYLLLIIYIIKNIINDVTLLNYFYSKLNFKRNFSSLVESNIINENERIKENVIIKEHVSVKNIVKLTTEQRWQKKFADINVDNFIINEIKANVATNGFIPFDTMMSLKSMHSQQNNIIPLDVPMSSYVYNYFYPVKPKIVYYIKVMPEPYVDENYFVLTTKLNNNAKACTVYVHPRCIPVLEQQVVPVLEQQVVPFVVEILQEQPIILQPIIEQPIIEQPAVVPVVVEILQEQPIILQTIIEQPAVVPVVVEILQEQPIILILEPERTILLTNIIGHKRDTILKFYIYVLGTMCFDCCSTEELTVEHYTLGEDVHIKKRIINTPQNPLLFQLYCTNNNTEQKIDRYTSNSVGYMRGCYTQVNTSRGFGCKETNVESSGDFNFDFPAYINLKPRDHGVIKEIKATIIIGCINFDVAQFVFKIKKVDDINLVVLGEGIHINEIKKNIYPDISFKTRWWPCVNDLLGKKGAALFKSLKCWTDPGRS